ncbi:MAG TPA: YafY family protein [Phototrophicaceae bacterium]|nr:YafY family protein [Phototrophicaceae bacterium]
MNRTDRLLAIVLELQARKQVSAEALAATFEVSKRTIYRDMVALSESGVPIVAIPGQGYSLVEGYFLPPLFFTTDEALMLSLGTDFVGQHFDTQYRTAAQSASHKILVALPEHLRREVEYLESSIQFITFNEPTAEPLQLLRRAIVQCRTVRFRYQARYQAGQADITSFREAAPYGLIHIGGNWMLIAYCYLRRDIRHFRLNRMEEVTLLNRSFDRPTDFKIQLGGEENRNLVVRALFDAHAAWRVQESPSGFQVAQEKMQEGLLVTFTVRQPDDLLNWLLSWGSHVRVLEPESLRALLAREAERILENHR